MPVIRLIVLLVVLGSLSLLIVQNWSPVLPLVFLGWQTRPLPLAMWILLSLIAGAVTSVLIASLFQLLSFFTRPSPSKRRKENETPPPRTSTQQRSQTQYSAPSSPPPEKNSNPSNGSEEWESDSTDNDDWNFEEDTEKTADNISQPNDTPSTTYEVNTEPKSSYRSGSVYSYSYREPKNSGVGKTESIYDADYRVLTPPYQPPPANDEDDWGLDDEDENEDDTKQK